MNGKLTLSFSVATFIAALAAMYFLSEVRVRLSRVENQTLAAADDARPADGDTVPGAFTRRTSPWGSTTKIGSEVDDARWVQGQPRGTGQSALTLAGIRACCQESRGPFGTPASR